MLRSIREVSPLLSMLAGALLLMGCGGGGGDDPGQNIDVTGQVKFDGKPLTDAGIRFTSRRSGTVFPVNLADDGTYNTELLDVEPGEEFDVSVGPPLRDPEAAEDQAVKLDDGGIPIAPSPPPVPQKYLEPTTSGLKATLSDESSQTFDFQLAPG